MDKIVDITDTVFRLLAEIRTIGRAEGLEEKDEAVEEAHTRGFDAGYEEAKREFRAPDL